MGDEIHVKPVKDLGESYVDTMIYKIQKDGNLNWIGTLTRGEKRVVPEGVLIYERINN